MDKILQQIETTGRPLSVGIYSVGMIIPGHLSVKDPVLLPAQFGVMKPKGKPSYPHLPFSVSGIHQTKGIRGWNAMGNGFPPMCLRIRNEESELGTLTKATLIVTSHILFCSLP